MRERIRGPWWAHCLMAGVFASIGFGDPETWLFRWGFALLALHSIVNAAESYAQKARDELAALTPTRDET